MLPVPSRVLEGSQLQVSVCQSRWPRSVFLPTFLFCGCPGSPSGPPREILPAQVGRPPTSRPLPCASLRSWLV